MEVYTPANQQPEDPLVTATEMKGIRQKLIFDASSDSVLEHLQATKQPVTVYLRIRPKSAQEIQLNDPDCLHSVNKTTLLAIAPSHCKILKNNGRGPSEQSKYFYFSQIYNEKSTQGEIFNECVLPLLEDFFDGQNCLLFSYGVTNSGKSYTITGTGKQPGILPRALDVIFNSIKNNQFNSHCIKPKFYAEATYLIENEEEADKALKRSLLNQAAQLCNRSCDHRDESCDQPIVTSSSTSTLCQPDYSTIDEGTVTHSHLHVPPLEVSDATSDVSSNISKMTFEAGSIGASMFEDLIVHEDHVIDVDTQDGSLCFSLWVSFAEIYNDYIFDLLADEQTDKPRPSLKLGDDRHRNTFIKGLREIKIDSTEEALQLLRLGLRRRHIAETRLNYQSSRSHSIFTIKIIRIVRTGRRPRVARINRISIVDLAGSERNKKTGATGERCKEAGSINNSIHVLGRCIETLRQNQKVYKKSIVPYRDSKLTQLLHTYFVGKGRYAHQEGRVVMILNVSNNASVFSETAHVLNFSALASKVKPLHDPLPFLKNSNIPELSPMKPIIEEEEEKEDTEVENDGDETVNEVLVPTGGPCRDCEEFKRERDMLKKDVVDLRLQLWEQETVIKQELTREFNKQIVEIQDEASTQIEEHEAIMDEEIKKRMEIFQLSTKKHYSRKRRCPDDIEEERQEQFEEIDKLHRIKRRLEQEVKEIQEELDLEKNKNSSELKDLTVSYETKITSLRCQFNEAIVASQKLKKSNEQLKIDISTKNQKYDNVKLQEATLLENNKQLEKELNEKVKNIKEMEEESAENRERVIKLESNLSSLNETVKQLTAQEKEARNQYELSSERDKEKILQLEREVMDLMDENGTLRKEVYLNNETWMTKEDDSKVKELKSIIAKMKKDRDILQEDNAQQLESLQTAATLEMNNGLEKLQEENDQEREELLLQLISLETSLNNEKIRRDSLENELKRREMETEVQADEMQYKVETLTSSLAALHVTVQDKTKHTERVVESSLRQIMDTITDREKQISLQAQDLHKLNVLVCRLKQHEKELSLGFEKQEKEMINLSIERDEKERAMERECKRLSNELMKTKEDLEKLSKEKIELEDKLNTFNPPPDEANNEDEHIYDSVHESFIINNDHKNKNFDDTCASRKLPILERSSMLQDDSFDDDDDFEPSVRRTINYDMTKDAKKSSKKPKKRIGNKKQNQDVLTPVTNQSPSLQRYNFRSRKKAENNENASPSSKPRLLTPPTLPRFFSHTKTSKSRKGRTTIKKKKINTLRKSQISGPLELEPESPIETTRRRQKLQVATSLEPCNYLPDLN